MIDIDLCEPLPDLFFQVLMIPIKIDEHFICNDFHRAGWMNQLKALAYISLIQVGQVVINQYCDAPINLVLHHLLDLRQFLLRILYHKLADVLPTEIEISGELFCLII